MHVPVTVETTRLHECMCDLSRQKIRDLTEMYEICYN